MRNCIFLFFVYITLVGCATDTYVSQENIDKYKPVIVQKFVLDEALTKPDVLVHFDFDKTLVKPEDQKKLNDFSERIRNQKGEVIISGHADLSGGPVYNEGLSYRRSLAIAEYLKKKEAVPSSHRYTLKALGNHHPLLQQLSTSANATNRRGYIFFKPS